MISRDEFLAKIVELCKEHQVEVNESDEDEYDLEFYGPSDPSGFGWVLGMGDIEAAAREATWEDLHIRRPKSSEDTDN